MDELGLDVAAVAQWFSREQEQPFILVRVNGEHTKLWAHELCDAVRRCYIADALVASKAIEHGVSHKEIIASRLPDAGSIMSGDFGEILVYIFQAAAALPSKLIGPIKWRLKQDRNKPAPHSDVVQFFLPDWPSVGADDAIFCSEVKAKSTASAFKPIEAALVGIEKDRTSRLAKTLVWLRDARLTHDLGSIQLEQLQRFIDTTDFPPAKRYFYAVAVICSTLEQAELKNVESLLQANCALIVVVVPDLKATYTAAFHAAGTSAVKERMP